MKKSNTNALMLAALVALAVVSVFVTKLAVAAGFLTFVAWLAQPKAQTHRVWVRGALVGSLICSIIGFYQFVLQEAIPGVVAGGKAAVNKHAVAFLRTVVAAQDKARRAGANDHDGDGVGSALRIDQLAGFALGGSALGALNIAPLALAESALTPTRSGTAAGQGGYYFLVCLPVGAEAWSASPESSIDLERAETEYRIYGWPQNAGAGHATSTWFADARERILELTQDREGRPLFVGTAQAPACDAVDTASNWSPWRDKAARDALPGANIPPVHERKRSHQTTSP